METYTVASVASDNVMLESVLVIFPVLDCISMLAEKRVPLLGSYIIALRDF